MVEVEKIKFRVNDKVEIVWNDGDYRSNVEDVTDKYLAITIPIRDGRYIPLKQGEMVEVLYYQENNIFKFYTSVIGRNFNRIPIILIDIPNKIYIIQRRKFVRVNLICDIKFSILGSKEFTKALVVDLSAGGARIRSDKVLEKETLIEVHMEIDKEEIKTKAKVVRVEQDKDSMFVYGISFIDIEEKLQDKIIKYIFHIMREQRKRA